jgi:hypothetical protein
MPLSVCFQCVLVMASCVIEAGGFNSTELRGHHNPERLISTLDLDAHHAGLHVEDAERDDVQAYSP